MKKCLSLVIMVHASLFAQSQPAPSSPGATAEGLSPSETAASKNIETAARSPTGSAAGRSSHVGRSSSWQNWIFAAAALAIAAVGVIVVTLNSGHDNPSAN